MGTLERLNGFTNELPLVGGLAGAWIDKRLWLVRDLFLLFLDDTTLVFRVPFSYIWKRCCQRGLIVVDLSHRSEVLDRKRLRYNFKLGIASVRYSVLNLKCSSKRWIRNRKLHFWLKTFCFIDQRYRKGSIFNWITDIRKSFRSTV